MSLAQLPSELIEIILRNLCTTSNPPFLSEPDSIKSAFSFAYAHSTHLNSLTKLLSQISTPPERFREDPLASTPTTGILIDQPNAGNAAHLAALIRLSHPFLRTLHLPVSPKEHSWIAALSPSPPLLRRLSLREVGNEYPLERLLRAVGPQLRELEIVGTTGVPLSQSQITAIGENVCNLSYLALRLSIFEYDWEPLWSGIGDSLTHLSIGATRFWIMDTEEDPLLGLISEFCTRLENLHFYHVGASLGPALSQLCARYAGQLKGLTLEQCQLHRPHLFRIHEMCPNVVVHVIHGSSLFSHAYNSDIIDVLAPKLGSLSYRTQLSHDESLYDLTRCKKLTELRLDCASTLSEQVLYGIVQSVGKSLKSLSLGFFVRSHDATLLTKMLDWLCEYSTTLEVIRIGGPVFDMSSLDCLLRKAHIKELYVTFGLHVPDEPGNVAHVLELLHVVERAVVRGTPLQNLVVKDRGIGDDGDWRDRVRIACLCLRGRVARVSVCGEEFV